jgi:hypothetical protein
MEAATTHRHAAAVETSTAHTHAAVETASATTKAAATATTATARQRHCWRSQTNRCNCQQRDHRLTHHSHSPSEILLPTLHVAIAPEKRYRLRHHRYSTLRERLN